MKRPGDELVTHAIFKRRARLVQEGPAPRVDEQISGGKTSTSEDNHEMYLLKTLFEMLVTFSRTFGRVPVAS